VELKKSLLASLTKGLRPDVVIASSSSGLPSSEFVQDCKNPERVLIAHPFNPPHVIPLVEIVPHDGTSKKAVQTAISFYAALGKDPVLLNKECPGFIANRLQAVLCTEAYSLVSRGIVSAKDLG
jgi:3-hydroxyacyl-CoA dehydrogenase